MEDPIIVSWQTKEYDLKPKEREWYWTVGIIAVSSAIAAFILEDYLFSLIALAGGFAVMLVGSKKPSRHKYTFTERGLTMGVHNLIPYSDMKKFAIDEKDPKKLSIETKRIIGTVSMPLAEADYRLIRTELKNRNIEEVETLDVFIDGVARRMGL